LLTGAASRARPTTSPWSAGCSTPSISPPASWSSRRRRAGAARLLPTAMAFSGRGADLLVSASTEGIQTDQLAHPARARVKLVYVRRRVPPARAWRRCGGLRCSRWRTSTGPDGGRLRQRAALGGPAVPALKSADVTGQIVPRGRSPVLFPSLGSATRGRAPARAPATARLASDFGAAWSSRRPRRLLSTRGFDRRAHMRRLYGARLARCWPRCAGVPRHAGPSRGRHAIWVTLPSGVDPPPRAGGAGSRRRHTRGEVFHVDGRGRTPLPSFLDPDAIAAGRTARRSHRRTDRTAARSARLRPAAARPGRTGRGTTEDRWRALTP
jgi:hypothetical protein